MYKLTKEKSNKKGFTIVEMLVAVSILVIAIGAPLFLATRSINLAITAKNRLVATFLAQEALEYIRNVRDTNVLKILDGEDEDWDDKFGDNDTCKYNPVSSSDKGCTIDIYKDEIKKCQGAVDPETDSRCQPLSYEIKNGEKRYGYDLPEESPFTRTVRVYRVQNSSPTSLGEYVVEVLISWKENGKTQTVSTQEHLFEIK